MKSKILPTILILLFVTAQVYACTTFFLNGEQKLFGRNFDFPSGVGHIYINPANIEKTSFIFPPEKPFTWVSKYGSISFNQNGREMPYGGINEAGLVIEQMWHQEAKYPEPDQRKALTELQWIQYHLDNSATVQDVINSDEKLRISITSVATLHFLVADASGDLAAIEFFDGKMVVHSGDELKYPVLSNCSYDVSLNYIATTNPNLEHTPWVENSSGRFKTAAGMIGAKDLKQKDKTAFAFEILDAVAQGESTRWSIVYDISNFKIHLKTNENKEVRTINFNEFDFSCTNTPLFIDIDHANPSVKNFKPFNIEDNFNLIDKVCNEVEFLGQMPTEYRQAVAAFPATFNCK
ncbi:linear amide C-N hydrolase [Alkalitalea saponilacus]|uniref:Linear amide C-N hydrolases, choloylglycine hydrolase family n=1 Tax=Alkalitalea saponilacus TaxID=889453 RepID=A0A1T5HRU7_9BACT|nr:linear amide C-N hydrolase [Alkalitalea saponilacus]SKC23428.1 Linear amide C-N hydrolases, choloylglycine hydrolase family [Alkalitalea saponilacus]